MNKTYGTLVVRNKAQKILFDEELSGQISDGQWENSTPHGHWEPWCDAEVVVGENVGRTFYARRDSYNFLNKELLEIVGDRMVEAVQKEIPSYTEEDMRADLKDLKAIIKIERPATPDEAARHDAARAKDVADRQALQDKRNRQAAEVKQLAEELGVDVGYIGTKYVSYDAGLSYAKVLKLIEAVRNL